jgi:hypothetical protein
MTKFDAKEFTELLAKCTQDTRALVGFLKTVAENAGAHVEPPTFDGDGVGITYRRGAKRFCRFDPKHQADHVGVSIPGADRVALAAAGTVSEREDGPWVFIENMRGAVRLVPSILRAYDDLRTGDEVVPDLNRRGTH